MSSPDRRGVVVSHPGRQHSHQAAAALHRTGRLAGYWAGVPSRPTQASWMPGALRQRLIRYAPANVPDALARWLPAAVLLRRMGRAMPLDALEQTLDFAACRAFDGQVARRLRTARARAIVACEISALDSFRVGKQLGMTTILDAPSVHPSVQDRVCPPREPAWLHRRIVQIKHAEIALADQVLTVSELAREGYLEAGVPPERVHAIALGADTRLFSPALEPGVSGAAARPFTFVFCGATIFRKGIDVLVDAFRRVEGRIPGAARLVVVGPPGDSHHLLASARSDRLVVHAPLAQALLPDIFRAADCFVLPSRHDSFGMAVIEAMACGLPAIVSRMVGAREAIEEGVSGWVVPVADAAALSERMAWCVAHRDAVAAMRGPARATAERYSWDRYSAQLARVFAAIFGNAP